MIEPEILEAIYTYYPRSMSSFDVPYYETKEYRNLKVLMESKDARWSKFLAQMVNSFKLNHIPDRTDAEPSKRCLLYVRRDNLLFEIVIHVALVVDYYSFYITKSLFDEVNIRYDKLAFVENEVLPEIEKECKIIFDALKSHYNYKLISTEVSHVLVPDVASFGQDLGKATVFNLLFADGFLSASPATNPDILNYKRDGNGYIDYGPAIT